MLYRSKCIIVWPTAYIIQHPNRNIYTGAKISGHALLKKRFCFLIVFCMVYVRFTKNSKHSISRGCTHYHCKNNNNKKQNKKCTVKNLYETLVFRLAWNKNRYRKNSSDLSSVNCLWKSEIFYRIVKGLSFLLCWRSKVLYLKY